MLISNHWREVWATDSLFAAVTSPVVCHRTNRSVKLQVVLRFPCDSHVDSHVTIDPLKTLDCVKLYQWHFSNRRVQKSEAREWSQVEGELQAHGRNRSPEILQNLWLSVSWAGCLNDKLHPVQSRFHSWTMKPIESVITSFQPRFNLDQSVWSSSTWPSRTI